jgi:hypothetical protein
VRCWFQTGVLIVGEILIYILTNFEKPSVTFVRKGGLSIKYLYVQEAPYDTGEKIMRSASVRIFRDN